MRLTASGAPPSHAPAPRSAQAISPKTGAEETPSSMRPRRITAICVENIG